MALECRNAAIIRNEATEDYPQYLSQNLSHNTWLFYVFLLFYMQGKGYHNCKGPSISPCYCSSEIGLQLDYSEKAVVVIADVVVATQPRPIVKPVSTEGPPNM